MSALNIRAGVKQSCPTEPTPRMIPMIPKMLNNSDFLSAMSSARWFSRGCRLNWHSVSSSQLSFCYTFFFNFFFVMNSSSGWNQSVWSQLSFCYTFFFFLFFMNSSSGWNTLTTLLLVTFCCKDKYKNGKNLNSDVM